MDDDAVDAEQREAMQELLEGASRAAGREARLRDPNFKHLPECIKGRREYARLLEKWEDEWPNHCRACNGHGSFSSYDDGWACDNCTMQGLCSRCGASLGPEAEWPCEECGFDGDPERPREYLCECPGEASRGQRW